ncbi:MAG: ribosome biogenesis GTPase Der [Rhodovibrionaceae bacterium]
MPFTLAIVGRPNVGKSTLFNRLVGKRVALVDDRPGVTRDRREGEGQIFDLEFTVVDTAGLEDVRDQSLEARMRAQTEVAIEAADAVLFLIDARAGVTPLDAAFAQQLRRGKTPIILGANKTEGRAAESGMLEAYALGLGDPIALSAEHGLGIDALYERLKPMIAEYQARGESESEEEQTLQLAVVGRPNVGKSTLINRLLGEDRLLTGPEAGITRDSIAVEWRFNDRPLRLVDTAGLRRKARVTDRVEKLSAAETARAIDFAQVVVLLLDATAGSAGEVMEKQDLTIARRVVEEGRALVLGLNKWDACENRQEIMQALRDRLERSFPQTKGIPIVTLSAREGRGTTELLEAVFSIYDIWNTRLPTAALNRWLQEVISAHPPPAPGGRRIRLKYITQAKSRPPGFVIFCTNGKDLPSSYLRYLENALRQDFGLPGTPIRIHLRKGDNPYV